LNNVIVVYSNQAAAQTMEIFYEDTDFVSYDGYSIIPTYKVQPRQLTLEKARYVMQKRNIKSCNGVGHLFNDLINICRLLLQMLNKLCQLRIFTPA